MQHIGDPGEFPAHSQPRCDGSDFSTARILIVDDDPGMQKMMVSYFREQNMDAVSAAGRREVLRHLAVTPPTRSHP
jgi:hypothetical protein